MSEHLTLSHAATGRVLHGLDAADWALPTGCDGWDVGDVVRHLVTGLRAFTVTFSGGSYDLAAIMAELAGVDAVNLPASYDAGAADLLRAAAAADDHSSLSSPLGPMPAESIRELRSIEALVHGWDVVTATGRPPSELDVPDRVVEELLAAAARLLDHVPPDRTPFGAPRPVADDAPPLLRLVALLGRDVRAAG